MALTQEEKESHARRLIQEEARDFEFMNVVEDWELAEADDADLDEIHDLITHARVEVSW